MNSLIPSELYWQNYSDAWNNYPLGLWLFNTFLVSTIETISTVITSVLAGYAFARLRFWGRDVLFVLYLGAMMVPIQVTLIPSFIIVRSLGLLNSYEGIAILNLVQFFGVFPDASVFSEYSTRAGGRRTHRWLQLVSSAVAHHIADQYAGSRRLGGIRVYRWLE